MSVKKAIQRIFANLDKYPERAIAQALPLFMAAMKRVGQPVPGHAPERQRGDASDLKRISRGPDNYYNVLSIA